LRRKYMAPPYAGAHMESRFVRNTQAQSNQNVALHFSTSDPSASAKSMGYVTRPGSNCRRWVLQDGRIIGQLADSGILRRRPEIAGIIFIRTEWHLIKGTNALNTAYHLHGFWNREWSIATNVTPYRADKIKKVLVGICVAYNDTNHTRRAKLARLCACP
jgi:hypothetical protein